jgi:hypothetical protein
VIVDAGPFIDSERVNTRLFALLKRATERGEDLHTTHPVLSQVWRDPSRQVHLQRALRAFTTHALDNSKAVGSLLSKSDTSDIADAHLATVAQALGTFIVTTDGDDMRRLGARFEQY